MVFARLDIDHHHAEGLGDAANRIGMAGARVLLEVLVIVAGGRLLDDLYQTLDLGIAAVA